MSLHVEVGFAACLRKMLEVSTSKTKASSGGGYPSCGGRSHGSKTACANLKGLPLGVGLAGARFQGFGLHSVAQECQAGCPTLAQPNGTCETGIKNIHDRDQQHAASCIPTCAVPISLGHRNLVHRILSHIVSILC